MRAIILAGGRGTRLRPLTDKIPKPLIPLNGIPMIERVVRSCEQAGVSEIFIVISYKANTIKNYFAGKRFKTKIKFIDRNIRNKLELFSLLKNIFYDEKFLLFSTDQIFEPNALVDFINKTKKNNAHMVISTCKHGMSGENKIVADEKNNVMSITRWGKQHYETGFIIYSTQIFEITDQLDNEIKNTTELIKLLLARNYRIKTLKTPDVYDVDNLYSLKKIEKILQKNEIKLSIDIVPPQPLKNMISNLLKSISKKYKTKHNDVNLPHITIKALFITTRKNLENICEEIKKITQNNRPFKIKILGWHYFTENPSPNAKFPYTLYMKISRNSILQTLHEYFSRQLSGFTPQFVKNFEMENYHPHMTLAHGDLTEENFKRALVDLKNFVPQYEFKVDNVFLVFKNSKMRRWKILKSFKLGG